MIPKISQFVSKLKGNSASDGPRNTIMSMPEHKISTAPNSYQKRRGNILLTPEQHLAGQKIKGKTPPQGAPEMKPMPTPPGY